MKLAPHLPADPEEKKTASKHKSSICSSCVATGEYDPKCGRDNNADYKGALALLG
jgi:transposase